MASGWVDSERLDEGPGLGVGPWRSNRRQWNLREQGSLLESTGIFRKQGGFLWLDHEVLGTEQ